MATEQLLPCPRLCVLCCWTGDVGSLCAFGRAGPPGLGLCRCRMWCRVCMCSACSWACSWPGSCQVPGWPVFLGIGGGWFLPRPGLGCGAAPQPRGLLAAAAEYQQRPAELRHMAMVCTCACGICEIPYESTCDVVLELTRRGLDEDKHEARRGKQVARSLNPACEHNYEGQA